MILNPNEPSKLEDTFDKTHEICGICGKCSEKSTDYGRFSKCH
jgi:hypothetical protein